MWAGAQQQVTSDRKPVRGLEHQPGGKARPTPRQGAGASRLWARRHRALGPSLGSAWCRRWADRELCRPGVHAEGQVRPRVGEGSRLGGKSGVRTRRQPWMGRGEDGGGLEWGAVLQEERWTLVGGWVWGPAPRSQPETPIAAGCLGSRESWMSGTGDVKAGRGGPDRGCS